jgi:3-methyladenine DNA glycosylase/8-oxoguanine DNA glycosylase
MSVDAMPDPVAASAPTEPSRIRELMLENLFVVFNERAPSRWRPYRSLAVSYLFSSEYDGQP